MRDKINKKGGIKRFGIVAKIIFGEEVVCLSVSAVGVFLCFKKFGSDYYGFVRCKNYEQPVSFKKSCSIWMELDYPKEKSLVFLEGIYFEEVKKDKYCPRASRARFATSDEVRVYYETL
ncbi:MAG: hypothetical protein PHS92_05475 [Candidatus Gracilibacteria bacterium]|nr:hypothetical protein [Candidatus Gracilibacteria bacterium]